MGKENAVYIRNGRSSRHKKRISPFLTIWMDLGGIMLSEMSERERLVSYDLTYMWNLISGQSWGWAKWVKRDKRYKILAIK